MTDPLYLACMAKLLILKEEGIIEKNSYERRAYESVAIGPTLWLYLKNQQKTKLRQYWVNVLI